ncbi:dihydrofolate reductase family protein [Streptacidiphilus fuscans]|uniref:Dihydrofolate reductase family protein n=1 Tax=Streptacidiphilus fuscans TaxID=2789292 RepID=A0A931F9Z9_9ACTN|nr:dihydrofolate reductase family protein [Streptacidiphilus fuscans]MBF9067142.1 dihydrofolate reductase family protein [Streptacidiphilus fuscans]
MSVIVVSFTTLDGGVTDPDGSAGTPQGGWLYRYGPEAITGDKFGIGPVLEDGVLLLGRTTWQRFATLWPARDDDFAARMNAAPKLVASRTLTDADLGVWSNSRLLDGDLVESVKGERRDVVVAGSYGIVDQLAAADLVDEYRLLTFPILVGGGRRLFPADGPHQELDAVQAELAGPLVRTRYRRTAAR